jgi:HSP20 family protein
VEELGNEIIMRLEVPGMEKEDFSITVEGNALIMSGEKRYERESRDSTYHVMERAYGSFQRSIPLPRNVDADRAQASYKNGVLSIRLPKLISDSSRTIRLS